MGLGAAEGPGGKTPGGCSSHSFPSGPTGCRDVSLLQLAGWGQVPLPFLMKNKEDHAFPPLHATANSSAV